MDPESRAAEAGEEDAGRREQRQEAISREAPKTRNRRGAAMGESNNSVGTPTMIPCGQCGVKFYSTSGNVCLKCRKKNAEEKRIEPGAPRLPPITIRTYS